MFKDYFYLLELKDISINVEKNNGITLSIRKHIRRRLKRIRFFEDIEIDGKTYIVIGTGRVEKAVRFKIFTMELYAYLKNNELKPTFKMVEKLIGGNKVKVFIIPRFGWLKEIS